MDKKILMSLGLPIIIENKDGKKATIELNHHEFVVCRFHPDNSVYLQDAQLNDWHPTGYFHQILYKYKVIFGTFK